MVNQKGTLLGYMRADYFGKSGYLWATTSYFAVSFLIAWSCERWFYGQREIPLEKRQRVEHKSVPGGSFDVEERRNENRPTKLTLFKNKAADILELLLMLGAMIFDILVEVFLE